MDYHEAKIKNTIFELCVHSITEAKRYESAKAMGNPYVFADGVESVPSAVSKMIDQAYPELKKLMEA